MSRFSRITRFPQIRFGMGKFLHPTIRSVIVLSMTCLLLLLFASTAMAATHVVRSGETLAQIAQYYSVSVSSIAAANGISNPNQVRVGQALYIPGPSAPPTKCESRYKVRAGDTMSGIAAQLGVNPYTLAATNGLANANQIVAGQRLCIPNVYVPAISGLGEYVVRPGDTLSHIAVRCGLKIKYLASINGISDSSKIRVGQTIFCG